MSTASVDRPLAWSVEEALARGEYPESYWRSLFYFNVYRLVVALLLLLTVAIWGGTIWFGSRDLTLFTGANVGYLVFSAGCFVLMGARRRFNLQLTLQVGADVVFVTILLYASSGISSGLGLLLLTTLAGAGLISRGRMTLFFAAIATIGVLLEQTYEVLRLDAPETQFVQAGLLSAAYFAIAWLAHALARYAVASEQLAAQRGVDLANLEQVNELVIRDMQDGVLVVDEGGTVRQCNARAERLLGRLPGGRGATLLTHYAPDLAVQFKEWLEAAVADIVPRPPFRDKLSARFVPIGGSHRFGAVIFLEDLSRIQAEARQLKLAALGRLTANIAHEIRNPLGAISHAAQLLQEEPGVTPTSTRLVTIINENSQRLDRMVNDVLRLNRGERAHRERFGLADFLEGFVSQFCQIEKIDRSVFRVECPSPVDVLFDRSHLNQVMWNLSRNALRHCRLGPASIVINATVSRGGGVVRLDVVDDGPGVSADARGKLFEPFFTTSAGGTGLGLYLAREVCEANGASLDYVDARAGAQFTVLCRTG